MILTLQNIIGKRYSSINKSINRNISVQKISENEILRMTRGLPKKSKINGIEKVITVASAKGANLAIAISFFGKKVGLLDADLFGPSIPKMFNLFERPSLSERLEKQFIPLTNYGIKTMSIGFLIDKDSPIVWRGLMVMKAIQQLIHDVDWGTLDLLIIDMPPGTGDIQLTITQQVILDGAIIVSTPQDIALIDAIRGINMFKKMDIKILGIVQNMSVFICPNCNYNSYIFGMNGLKRTAKNMNIDVLVDIPLHENIVQDCEKGRPTVIVDPNSPQSLPFKTLADIILKKL
ncbi:hypothetical protein PCK1_000357 [Pneumocystis canis]|nr:hypothetical protein PCK1_000357 [Pneumocystis canis]